MHRPVAVVVAAAVAAAAVVVVFYIITKLDKKVSFFFIGLIVLKLYYALSISYSSKTEQKALSSFMTDFSSYNVIDSDHVIADKNETEVRP